jgi:ribosomal protein L37AE/L43A
MTTAQLPYLFDLLDGTDWAKINAEVEREAKEHTAKPPHKGACETCRRVRTVYPAAGGSWVCGTCQHREARRIDTKEMWGHGRRGY